MTIPFLMADWPGEDSSVRTVWQGPEGNVECLIERPNGRSKGIMLICHPHPQFGGTMDNKVVYSLARSGLANGWTTVRFNFRGVGKSEGSYGEGIGELEDAEFVLNKALSHQPGLVMLAGFSFGTAVVLRLSESVSSKGLILIAPPLHYFDAETMPQPGCPCLVVHGDKDEVVSCEDTMARLGQFRDKPEVSVMKDAGHFFHGRLTELRVIVDSFLNA